jgi:nucleotide-binding universal stress UspA family protein
MGLETPRKTREMVDRWVHQIQAHGLHADGAVAARAGSISEQILEDTREFQADLAVVGSRGLSPFRGLLLGSVSHVVLQLAPCPVLVVRGRVPRRHVERRLLAFDGSRQSREALTTSILLADRLKARVLVAHAHPGGGSAAERIIADAVQEVEAQGVRANSLLIEDSGHAGPHLARTAAENRCDLIVMGARGHSELAALLLGSVTFKMVQLAPCSVLVVR